MGKTLTWPQVKEWLERKLGRFRDAFMYFLFTSIFSILPTISGFLLLKAFGKWTGEWSKLLESGDLLVASASLMATAVYVFRKPEARSGFLRNFSQLLAIVVIVFSTIFYAALALSAQGIIPASIKMLPQAIVAASVVIYCVALAIGFHAFYTEQPPPSSIEVRDKQVSSLEAQLNQLGEGQ